jgi:hypothetical protein
MPVNEFPHEQLFSDRERRDLTRPYPSRIINAIARNNLQDAIALCEEMRGSQILLHDFFADSCAFLWSWIGRTFGEDTVEAMFRCVFSHAAKRQYFDAAGAQVMPHLTVGLLAESWRAHSCFGAGEHPGAFSITEDREKFTFHLHPCGSGARLWKKGWYETGRGGQCSEKEQPWTYQRKGVPYYCIHCPFLNEILPFESGYGYLLWPTDPLTHKDGECAWHIYKDPTRIPARYYHRLGLSAPKNTVWKGLPPRDRFFSDQELAEMARPMPDRIIDQLKKGNHRAAAGLCRKVKGEFLALHDLYVMMLSSTLTFISDQGGEDALGTALEQHYHACVASQIVDQTPKTSLKHLAVFLASMIFNPDTCNRSGYHPGRFTIEEDGRYVRFILDPCGSGGRLLRAGSCGTRPAYNKIQEQIENAVIRFAAHHLPLPERLLKKVFPLVVTHFTQRKPFNQGTTRTPHSWSFNRKGIAYYCCQCGMLQKMLGCSGLTITPPRSRQAPCVWQLDKQASEGPATPG